MRVAHIIIAHKGPAQLHRLLKRLTHPRCDFYIHIDKKADIRAFEFLDQMDSVRFIKNRTVCNWGGFSLLAGIVNSLGEVIARPEKYDCINVLSAQDYPLVSANNLMHFLESRKGYSFMTYLKDDDHVWLSSSKKRYEKYHLTDFYFWGRYFLQNIMNRFAPARKFPFPVFYGSNFATWCTFSRECAEYIVRAFKERRELSRFFRFSWGVDEFVIPSLVMNSPHRDKVVNNSYRYVDWSEEKASPKILTMGDFENIIGSNMLFARKFDTDVDAQILDKIDEYVRLGSGMSHKTGQ